MDNRTVQIARVVDVAQGEVSRSSAEHPRGSNLTKYGRWYGMDGVPWCAIGLSWVINKAGLDFGVHGPRTAWVPDYRVWARARGRWSTGKRDVRVGDIMAFRGGRHVELVTRVSGSRFWCVGFNTSWRGSGGSFADGVFVAENERTHDTVDGTLHPFYGVTDGMVRVAQEVVGGVTVDGDLGPRTMAAVRRWQGANGLTADGIPGADTYAAMTGGEVIPAPSPGTSAPSAPPSAVKGGRLVVDGRLGVATVKALQRFLNSRGADLVVDGRAGEATWLAFQVYLSAPYLDGQISRQSYRADELGNGVVDRATAWEYTGRGSDGSQTVELGQRWCGVDEDGIWFEGFTAGLQRKLNDHGVGM